MIRWTPPAYSGGRSTASVGSVVIGYVVPPVGRDVLWRWYITFTRGTGCEGTAIDEHYARVAVGRRWLGWMRSASLSYSKGRP